MKIQPIDLKKLRVFPLAERKSLTRIDEILVDPDAPPPSVSDDTARQISRRGYYADLWRTPAAQWHRPHS
jgi:predicted AAA+ superfamily ATPase